MSKRTSFRICIPSAGTFSFAYDSVHGAALTNGSEFEVGITTLYNNTRGLPELYNECIDSAVAEDVDWLILMHDDVQVEQLDFLDRIARSNYELVGLAGAQKLQLKSPALWHLMAEKGSLRGAVSHLYNPDGGEDAKMTTSFGPYPARCVIMDGLFLAINKSVFQTHRFDETNPAKFHFYDLDYTLAAHKLGFKVGVADLLVTHISPGLREYTPEWKAGEEWFLNKHNA